MRMTPLRLLVLGVVLFAVGFGVGVFNVDPLSAWIGTAGLAVAVAAVVWIGYDRFRRHAHRSGASSDTAEVNSP